MTNIRKFNNLAVRMGLYTLIALMFVQCKSDTDNQNQSESETKKLEHHISKAPQERGAIHSSNIEILRDRNAFLTDSIRNAKIHRIAKKYPLNKFLSSNMLKVVQKELRHGCSEYSKPFAKRIIDGHGTLFDLYNVSFEVGFADLAESFSIIDVVGTVRFGDKKLDALCQKFDDEIYSVYITPQTNPEIRKNQNIIHKHDSVHATIDSLFNIYHQSALLFSMKTQHK